jgi:FAD-dependent oxidoreductase family protein
MQSSTEQFDVVVVGGGAAGVGAAVGAAHAGARTLLVETAGCLGGAATLKSVQTYCGLYTIGERPRPAVLGVTAHVVQKLRAIGGAAGPMKFRGVFLVIDSEAVKLVLDEVCAEAGVDVMLHAHVIGAVRDGGLIRSVTYHDHNGGHEVLGRAFVDASGECDLAFFAGAATRYGNHGFINIGTLGIRFGGIKPDADLRAETWTAAIRKARAGNEVPLSKERSLVVRVPLSGDVIAYLASEVYDARDAKSISRAESSGRRQAWAYLDIIRTIKGCEDAYLAVTGPIFGTRESRHVNCMQQVKETDVLAGARFPDSIALGAWGMEFHNAETMDSTFLLPGRNGVYEIPLGAVTSADTANLFAAGRAADGDQMAGASLRVMGTAFATGQACGVAAAQYAQTSLADAGEVQKILRGQGALIDGDDLPEPVELQRV